MSATIIWAVSVTSVSSTIIWAVSASSMSETIKPCLWLVCLLLSHSVCDMRVCVCQGSKTVKQWLRLACLRLSVSAASVSATIQHRLLLACLRQRGNHGDLNQDFMGDNQKSWLSRHATLWRQGQCLGLPCCTIGPGAPQTSIPMMEAYRLKVKRKLWPAKHSEAQRSRAIGRCRLKVRTNFIRKDQWCRRVERLTTAHLVETGSW